MESITLIDRTAPLKPSVGLSGPPRTSPARSSSIDSLLQQTVDFDFTSGSEVDATVDYDRDDKTGG